MEDTLMISRRTLRRTFLEKIPLEDTHGGYPWRIPVEDTPGVHPWRTP
jgi:hypothetical protein